MKTKTIATFFAILAAALYAINIPLSKILLQHVSPTMMRHFSISEQESVCLSMERSQKNVNIQSH